MRNGFGLIEILVVIVIIALILILLPKQITTLPSDIKVEDNSANKNTFLIEVKNIYNEANNKYTEESMNGNKLSIINNNENKLNVASNINYCIKFNNRVITNMKVSNEKYHIIYTNDKNISDITVNDIKDSKLEDMSC